MAAHAHETATLQIGIGERPGLATLCGGLMAIAGMVVVALRGRS